MPPIIEEKKDKSNKDYKKLLIIFLIVIFVVFFIIFIVNKKPTEQAGQEDVKCYTEVEKEVQGRSMEPLIKNGSKVLALEGYYDCHMVLKGDIVEVTFPTRSDQLIKKVLASQGDSITIDSSNYILINGKKATNSQGNYYKVDNKAKIILTSSLKDGKIRKGSYLILSDNVALSSFDSRDFGYVTEEYITSKIDLNYEK